MVRPLAGVRLAFYVLQEQPIAITVPLDKPVVAWRADWQVPKNLLVDDALVGRYFFLAIFCNDRRATGSDSSNAIDGRLEPLLEDSHFCRFHRPLLQSSPGQNSGVVRAGSQQRVADGFVSHRYLSLSNWELLRLEAARLFQERQGRRRKPVSHGRSATAHCTTVTCFPDGQ